MSTTTQDLPRLATAEEVAGEIGLSTGRLYELVRLNLIPAVRIGRSVRFNRRAVAEWLASGGSGPWSPGA